jgi:hypothetical protein
MQGNNDGQIGNQGPQHQQISAKEFAAKYNSKRECYNFLAVDAGVYLPAYDQVTIYFLKDIISGKKKRKLP